MIKCVIFDLGGVAIDFYNDDDYYPYLSRISHKPLRTIKRVIDYDVRVDIDKGTTTQKFFDREVAKQLKIKEKDVLWYEFYKKKAKPYKGTIDIIKKLRERYAVAYLSNTDRSRYTYTVEILLKRYLHLFDYRFASCDIGLRKPGPQIYKYALRHMKMKASEVIFVDNQIENVIGARKLDIRSILFTNSSNLRKQLKKLGVKV